ncbi:trigger factor [Candidatus Saccharibacteria bacterium]|nr:trigger factor [Candidatus Saccharibacteria bacterium]
MKNTLTKHATSAEIAVTLNKSDLESARLKALARLAGNLKIAGFRKGKAPANVVEKHVDANELASQTLDIAVRTVLPKLFSSNKIQPISVPQVDITKYVPGELAEFIVKSDIMPEIKLGNYRKLKAKKPEVKTKTADVNEILERVAKGFAEKNVVKRKAKLTDEVVIDFIGKKDGIAFKGGTAKDFKLELGSGQFIPGFEESVVGHESGDKFDVKLTFPKDYHNEELAGAKAVFEVLLKQVNEVKIPKIDDELAKKAGTFKTLAEFKADIKKNLAAQNNQRVEEKYKDDLVLELAASSQVEAPETLVADQVRFIREDFERNLQSRGTTFEDFLKDSKKTEDSWKDEANQIAINRVKAMLVLQALADELKIEVADQEVKQKLTQLKDVYQKDPNALKQLEDPRVESDIKNRLRVEKTLDALVKANA